MSGVHVRKYWQLVQYEAVQEIFQQRPSDHAGHEQGKPLQAPRPVRPAGGNQGQCANDDRVDREVGIVGGFAEQHRAGPQTAPGRYI